MKVEEHGGLESDAIEKGKKKKERWILQVQGGGRAGKRREEKEKK